MIIHKIASDLFHLKQAFTYDDVIDAIDAIQKNAPFRRFLTPYGKKFSVLSTNAGNYGWVSTSQGYRYTRHDPITNKKWPAIPKAIGNIAYNALHHTDYATYSIDTCLINYYTSVSNMGAHKDDTEHDIICPIISLSLGADSLFFLYKKKGMKTGPKYNILLKNGDILIWGGHLRHAYHGIKYIDTPNLFNPHNHRYNITLRHTGFA